MRWSQESLQARRQAQQDWMLARPVNAAHGLFWPTPSGRAGNAIMPIEDKQTSAHQPGGLLIRPGPTAAMNHQPARAATVSTTPNPPRKKEKSASEYVFQGILRELEAHALVPGQRLVEADLSNHFGVGRNSVREALQRLAAEGVIELLPHKGAAIRSLSLPETLDVLDVAERMLGLLARTAVRGSDQPLARAALEGTLQELARAEQAQDASAFARSRRRFYRILLEMGGNRELMRLFPTILMPVVHAQHRLPTLQKMRLADYQRIAQAVLEGSPNKAEIAASAHVRHVRTAIVQADHQPT